MLISKTTAHLCLPAVQEVITCVGGESPIFVQQGHSR
jgi:hypothetical protein